MPARPTSRNGLSPWPRPFEAVDGGGSETPEPETEAEHHLAGGRQVGDPGDAEDLTYCRRGVRYFPSKSQVYPSQGHVFCAGVKYVRPAAAYVNPSRGYLKREASDPSTESI